MIRAVIFDFDGTIADTIPAIAEGINLTMERHGYPTHTEAEVRSYINNGPRMLIRRALPKELQDDEYLLDGVLSDYDRIYKKVCEHTDKPYSGIEEVVLALRAKGILIGVLSNKQDHLLGQMVEAVLPGTTDAVQGSLANRPTKPDPYLTNRILSSLGVSAQECVIVGDSDVDIKTAEAIGCPHIGVTWGYRDEEFLRKNGAKVIVDTPKKLLDAIKQLNA